MRKLIDIVKILVGCAAGFYALLQAVSLNNPPQPGGSSSEQAYTVGGTTGSIFGLVLGGIICVTLLWSAFVGKRKKKAPAQEESTSDSRAKRTD